MIFHMSFICNFENIIYYNVLKYNINIFLLHLQFVNLYYDCNIATFGINSASVIVDNLIYW